MASRLALAGLLIATLVLGIAGIGRSLWLDEAWVGNSINAPSLGEMFYYPTWLQSSPPLFLLASRGAVRVLGLSNISLRLVPLLMALAATACFFAAAKRVLTLPFAALACSLLVFYSAEVEYSRSAKQYSGEVAISALLLLGIIRYLQKPFGPQFVWLALAAPVALPFSYASIFVLPGLAGAVYLTSRVRAVALTALAGAVLALLYTFFIRQNAGSELRAYWASDSEAGFSKGSVLILAAATALTFFSVVRSKGKLGIRQWVQITGLIPAILLAIAAALGRYPLSYRTRLFVVPGLIFIFVFAAEELLGRFMQRRFAEPVAVAAIAITVALGLRAQIRSVPGRPKEDVDHAVLFLKNAVPQRDVLLVHPSVAESFRLYADMRGWRNPPAVYGDTGWPCCPRGKNARALSSSKEAVVRDLDRMVPNNFSGRVWMLYTIRPTHWDWVGLDESKLWRSYMAARGCLVRPPDRRFENLAITLSECRIY